ncbi:MAG: type VII secretion protein EccCa [Micromonosporaceae bacterium]
MSTVVVKRPTRRNGPELPAGEMMLDSPPENPPPSTSQTWMRTITILPMIAGGAAMALMFSYRMPGPMGYIIGGVFGFSILGMLATQILNQGGQPSKKELIEARRDYMRRLAQTRRTIRNNITEQRQAMFYRHPDPDALWSTVESVRLWERRSSDGDFGVVRVGLGPQEVATPLVPPDVRPVEDLEPVSAQSLRRFVTTYSLVPELPVAMALRGFSRVYVQGENREQLRSMLRCLLAQTATFHAPDDMLIAVCCAPDRRSEWEWTKWLPHSIHPEKTDALGQLRLVAGQVLALEAMLDDVIANRPRFSPTAPPVDGPHITVVLDDGDTAGSDHLMTEGGVEGVTVIDMTNRPPRALDRNTLVLEIDANGKLRSATMDGSEEVGKPDAMSIAEAEALARQLAPLRLSVASRGDQPMSAELGLAELLDMGDPYELDTNQTWVPRPNRDKLRVPIGLGPDGMPVDLDLKESAQDGMGPHGLLIGATGSGKSELLRTLVLALAVTHSSEVLNFVLVDFKGGATFTTLDRLPHTSAVITNLEDELSLVDRMLDAIQGELIRRQELLRKAGNYASQRDYEKARAAGAPLAPLPSLLMICDEFSELLTAKPDFIDMFVQIGRVGRSLGVHLLLASQRLEEGRLRGLDTHLSYRVGLRTFSAMESRVVLGVPDAYELPRSPGHGYMKFGTEPLVRFKAAYVSGAHRRSAQAERHVGSDVDLLLDYSTHYHAPRVTEEEKKPDVPVEDDSDILKETLLDVLVGRLEGKGVPAHQVWLPPLAEPPTLDQLLPPLTTDSQRGVTVSNPDLHGALQAVGGIVDRPFEQRRDLMWVDLAGAAGHTMVVGGPQSGKSTLVRTLITTLALSHTPREAQFYCLDFGGGSLMGLREMPHMGGVATRLDVNAVRRTVAEVTQLMEARERHFADHSIDSISTYRKMRRDGQFADDPFGDVFLVVDGWLTMRQEFEDLEPMITKIANSGLGLGVHLIAAATRWMDVRPAVRDLFGTRLELRLGDPTDSAVNRKAAMNVPEGAPGRGLTPDGLHFLSGVPRIDGQQSANDLTEGVAKLVQTLNNAWTGVRTPEGKQAPRAPKVRLLPPEFSYVQLPKPAEQSKPGVPIGLAENDLQPVHLDFTSEPHLLLFGDVESGKSSFLRVLARSIADRYTPRQAKLMAIDYRRSLLGAISEEHRLGYGTSSQVTADMVAQVVTVMKERIPGPDVTPEQLRARNWWSGPDLYMLIDDYDMVASPTSNPLLPLQEFIAMGRDIGLHLIVTRRMGGAGRAMYDPMISRIRELASPGIMMSGDKSEGVLLGNMKPQPLPPGRGWLITRREGARLIQVAWDPPPL